MGFGFCTGAATGVGAGVLDVEGAGLDEDDEDA